jgi:predicted RNA-binding protein YlqC (UPF0109 family)
MSRRSTERWRSAVETRLRKTDQLEGPGEIQLRARREGRRPITGRQKDHGRSIMALKEIVSAADVERDRKVGALKRLAKFSIEWGL